MCLMIYAQLGLLYFCPATILREDSGGCANPGAALHWRSDTELADID